MYYAFTSEQTVEGLVQIIKLLTSKEIQSLRMHKPFHGEKEVVEQLYKFKNEIKIFGDKYAKLY